jgi:hypothetical protein
MSLKYSDRPVLLYGNPSRTDEAIRRLPQNAQSLATAPAGPAQIIDRADGRVYWAQHRRDAWRKLGPEKDFKTCAVRWTETGDLVQQPVAWLPRQR